MKCYRTPSLPHSSRRRPGFTLVQVLIVLVILSMLAALLMGSFGKSRAEAARAQCDIRMKSIALALDTYKQEIGHYPKELTELRTRQYLADPQALRCPADPRLNGSYADYYVLRAPRDNKDLPSLLCPFHEQDQHGAQAYVGHYTTQFATRPARLTAANSATVARPGKAAVAATAGMELRGGDLIQTSAQGLATIEFTDGSVANLQGGAKVTVLQSFLEGQSNAPLYTLVKQTLGNVTYRIHHGSKFDVATPTATAGARGTEFKVDVSATQTKLFVVEGKVFLTSSKKTVLAPETPMWITADSSGSIVDSLGNAINGVLNGVAGGLSGISP